MTVADDTGVPLQKSEMIVTQIAAMSRNRVIGRKNGLPWHIPEDLKFFRAKTKGHICIMGRKTFESIGCKPLPHRLNIVVTRTPENFSGREGVTVVPSLAGALAFAKTEFARWPHEIFIIGGGEMYRDALPVTNRIYLTEIDQVVEGDTYFPKFSSAEFHEVSRDSRTEGDMSYAFVTYERLSARQS